MPNRLRPDPTSAPEIEALSLHKMPTAAALKKKRTTLSSEKSLEKVT